jgi:uncharacterized protein
MNQRADDTSEPALPCPLLPLRLQPGDDLRLALQAHLPDSWRSSAFVLTGIGSLSVLRLRLAGAAEVLERHGDFELLTLAGSLSPDGGHLHASVADASGHVLGGHVAPGCIVRTTAEVLVAAVPGWHFSRAADAGTGYAELVVRQER